MIFIFFLTSFLLSDSLNKYNPLLNKKGLKIESNIKGNLFPSLPSEISPVEIDLIKSKAKNYIPNPVDFNDIVTMETNFGIMEFIFFSEEAPNHSYNFKKLANSGFYDKTYFHRIIKNFMIQGGDINTRDNDYTNDGLGDPGWLINEEFNDIKHKKGILSMARGPNINSAGSQFFICSADAPWLDGKYTAFGKVIENLYAIDLLENTETDRTQMLRSCFSEIAKGENPEHWVMVRDGSKGILYSKIKEEYSSKEEYRSYVRNQLNSNKPIAAPKIIKVRVVNENDIK